MDVFRPTVIYTGTKWKDWRLMCWPELHCSSTNMLWYSELQCTGILLGMCGRWARVTTRRIDTHFVGSMWLTLTLTVRYFRAANARAAGCLARVSAQFMLEHQLYCQYRNTACPYGMMRGHGCDWKGESPLVKSHLHTIHTNFIREVGSKFKIIAPHEGQRRCSCEVISLFFYVWEKRLYVCSCPFSI